MSERDQDTRARVLNAAARLFAQRGFAKVTVRDICRKARANVAAVNYHFGGKGGLYHAVMQTAMETMQATTAAARTAGHGLPPDQRLRAYVSVFLHRVVGQGHDSWIHQLMMREIADPTPALDMVFDNVIRPRMSYLSSVIGELLGCPVEDPRAMKCALSVHSQCQALMWAAVGSRLAPGFDGTPDALDAMADHITRFSLGGVRAIVQRALSS